MNKLYYISGLLTGIVLLSYSVVYAAPFLVGVGGTGTTTPSGILYGDNGSTTHLNTVGIGSGCTFVGGVLSCPGTGPSLPVSIENGGTASTSAVTNGVYFFNGINAEADNTLTWTRLSNGILTVGSTDKTSSPWISLGTNSTNANQGVSISGGRAILGYSSQGEADAILQTATGHGIVFLVNAATAGTFDPARGGQIAGLCLSGSATGCGAAGSGSAIGNIGVGTTSPFAKLAISGAAGGTPRLFAISTSTAAFATSTSLLVDSSGNLSLLNGTSLTVSALATGCATITSGLLGSTGTACGTGSGTVGSGTTGQFPYYAANGTTLTATSTIFITPAGRIGIGTITPTDVNANAALTVAGIGSQDIIASTTDNTTLSDAILQAYAPGSRVFLGAHGTNQVSARYGITLGGWGELGSFNTTSGATNGFIIGTNPAVPIVFGTNNLERMRILSSGQVGIGTTSPYASLSIMAGGSYAAQSQTAAFAIGSSTAGTATSTLFSVLSGGTVLVGTTTAPYTVTTQNPLLNVAGSIQLGRAGSSGNGFDVIPTGGNSGTGYVRWVGASNSIFQIAASAGGGILRLSADSSAAVAIQFFGRSGVEVGRFDLATANFGVGTTTPWASLSVAGTGSATVPLFAIASTTTTLPVFEVDSTGHMVTSGPKPVLSSCGTTNSISGNDNSGTIMFTGTLVTSCTMTFANAVPASQTVECQASTNTTVAFADVSATSTTAVTFGTSASLSSGAIFYSCERHQ